MKRGGRQAIAESVVGQTIRSLPPDLKRFADEVGVAYEDAVAQHWQEDGVEPDSLGLFSGPSMRDADAGQSDEAPLVSLFLENILDWCGGDEDAFDEEVERTFLHELGHFLGLEEDDMAPRDLD